MAYTLVIRVPKICVNGQFYFNLSSKMWSHVFFGTQCSPSFSSPAISGPAFSVARFDVIRLPLWENNVCRFPKNDPQSFELYCIWNRYIKNCATYSHSCSELCSLVFDRTAGDISTSLGRYPWRPLRVCIHSGGQRLGLTWWPWLSVFRECRL